MYAIVEIAGSQYRVKAADVVNVPALDGSVGDELTFTNILATGDDNETQVGTPFLSGSISAKILSHGKGVKQIVFHKKRRKGYRKKNGHRQPFTQIEINNISV